MLTYKFEEFKRDVLPAAVKHAGDWKDSDALKAAVLDYCEQKEIQVVDEAGNAIDLKGTLVLMAVDSEPEPEPAAVPAPSPEKSIDQIVTAVVKRMKATTATTKAPDRLGDSVSFNAIEMPRMRGKAKNFKGVIEGKSAEERAFRFGNWALAAIAQSTNREFPQAKRYLDNIGIKLHWEGSNSAGGFLVPDEFGSDIVDLREQYGVARQVLKVVPMSSDTRTDPRRSGGLTAYFVGEGAAGTESTKSWDNVALIAKKLVAITRMTSELSEDAVINIGDDLAGEISYAFANKEDQCAFNGDGTSTYGGMVGVRTKLTSVDGAGTDSAGLVSQASGNTWAALTLADFNKVISVLPEYADTPNARWICHRTFFFQVMHQLEAAASGNTMTDISSGKREQVFLGYPVTFSQVYPSSTATSTVACSFGDHSLGGRLGDRRGVTIAFSEDATIGGENVFERDEIAVRGTERFDVNIHDAGTSSTAGPICGLATGS